VPFASILRHAHAQPDRIALVISGRATTYRQLAQLVCAARDWIAPNLPGPREVVAICSRQPLVDWVLLLATRSLGRTVVAAPDLAMPARLGLGEVEFALTLAAPGAAAPEAPAGMRIAAIPLDVLNRASGLEPPAHGHDAGFGDAIEYTSGTTGISKPILRTGLALPGLCDRTRREYAIGPSTAFYFADLPPWTSVGSKGPMTVWREGGTCVFDFRKDWAAHVLDFPIDRMFAPPRAIHDLALAQFPRRAADLIVYSGGGFLSFRDASMLRGKLGCTILHHYAGTEFGIRLRSVIADEQDVLWFEPFGDPGIEIVDAAGRATGVGEQGEIRVRLHACDPRGYIGNDAATREHFQGGWFLSGDIAERREDGRIRIFGRTADVLNFSGVKRPVGPIEARARELLGGVAVCLFVRQEERGEEVLHVMVETGGELAPDRTDAFNGTFSAVFPRIALHRVAAFPRSGAMQKIDRNALVAMIPKPTG